MIECPGEKNCQHVCPWVPGQDDRVKKCEFWIIKSKERKVLAMVLNAGRKLERIPRFKDLDYSKNNIQKEVAFIRSIHVHPNHLFFIHSDPGTGKTHCLLAYTLEMLCKGINAYYVTSAHLRDLWLNELNWIHNPDLYSYDIYHEIAEIEESEILAIDDFGHEGRSETGHFQKNLEGILTSTGKKIIIASNINFKHPEFPYKNDKWIMDRLNQAFLLTWRGISYREPVR